MNEVADPPRSIRGRQALVIDFALMLVSALLAAAVIGIPVLFLVPSARVVALAATGVYHLIGPIAGRDELVQLFISGLAGSAVGYTVAFVLIGGVTSDKVIVAAFESAFVLGLMSFYRVRAAGFKPSAVAPTGVRNSKGAAQPLHANLVEMFTAFSTADRVYQPSGFWSRLSQEHVRHLASPAGIANLKQTVNTSYFQFGLVAFLYSVPSLVAAWVRWPDIDVWRARTLGTPDIRERALAILIGLYANAIRHRPFGSLLDRISEPRFGNPVAIAYKGHLVSEDLCHSVEEYASVMGGVASGFEPRRVLELGAGYGRLAYVFATAMPAAQYFIVDIPPALHVSQTYLTTIFPEVPTFPFRRFESLGEVATELAASRFVFLEPQQLEFFPDGYFDLVLTVSTLHEMRRDQIAHYLQAIDRLCRGYFYMKQWRRFYNPSDNIVVTRADYVAAPRWAQVFERSPLVPRSFFEVLYRCR
jgi:putative sugar O-methyltransferase